MMKDALSPAPEEARVGQLADILTTSIKESYLDERIWQYGSWRIEPFAETRWRDELSIPRQLQDVFNKADDTTKKDFQLATAKMIGGWDIAEEDVEHIRDSLYLAGLTRATPAIPAMTALMESPKLYTRSSDDILGIQVDVSAVFHGFGSIPGVKDDLKPVLDRWLYDDRFEKMTGQFLGAISGCSPDDYATYFQRVFDVNQKLGGFFDMGIAVERLQHTVSPEILAKHLDELSPEARTFLEPALENKKLFSIDQP